LASLLAQCHEPEVFDPVRAAELAQKAIELAPTNGDYWLALGIARYRAGDWRAAVRAVVKSRELHNSSEIGDQLYLAMAYWHQGERDQARSWYDRASSWMERNELKNQQLLHLRDEAAAMLGLARPPKSPGTKEENFRRSSKP
jgi:tetratricopeptide (TPR) repeat protein